MKKIKIKDCPDYSVFLVKGTAILSKLIFLFQWFMSKDKVDSIRSHAAIKYSDIQGNTMLSEMLEDGCDPNKFMESDYYKKKTNILVGVLKPQYGIITLDKQNLFYKLIQFFEGYQNPKGKAKYDYEALFVAQPLKCIIEGETGIDVWIEPNSGLNKNRFICGQYVAFLYYIVMLLFKNWVEISPEEIAASDYFDWYELDYSE